MKSLKGFNLRFFIRSGKKEHHNEHTETFRNCFGTGYCNSRFHRDSSQRSTGAEGNFRTASRCVLGQHSFAARSVHHMDEHGLIGESFAFGVTKTVKGKALRASTEPLMTIPVTSASAF